jgi:hypothetical protein
MIQLGSLHLVLSQMLFEQANDGLVHAHALAPCSLADRLVEIGGKVPERNGFYDRSLCIAMCITVMQIV